MRGRPVEIRFRGEADRALVERFDCLDARVGDGVTLLLVAAGDAAALHGVLDQIAVLGLELIDVRAGDDIIAPHYEVQFRGAASDAIRASFDGFDLLVATDWTGVVVDPVRLPEVLDRVESLGLELVAVRLVGDPAPNA